jgi:hypothetical protein
MDLSGLTQEELDAMVLDLATRFGIISDQLTIARREVDRRARAVKAKTRVTALNDLEKDALRKELL